MYLYIKLDISKKKNGICGLFADVLRRNDEEKYMVSRKAVKQNPRCHVGKKIGFIHL